MLLTRQEKSLVFNTLCLACRAGGSLALSPGQRAGLREVKMLELQIRQRQRIDKISVLTLRQREVMVSWTLVLALDNTTLSPSTACSSSWWRWKWLVGDDCFGMGVHVTWTCLSAGLVCLSSRRPAAPHTWWHQLHQPFQLLSDIVVVGINLTLFKHPFVNQSISPCLCILLQSPTGCQRSRPSCWWWQPHSQWTWNGFTLIVCQSMMFVLFGHCQLDCFHSQHSFSSNKYDLVNHELTADDCLQGVLRI